MLEIVARPYVVVDGRRVSTWRILAGLGLLAGVAVLPAAAIRAGLPPLEALACVPFALGADLLYSLGRRAVTGDETRVLYEHLAVTLTAASGVAAIAGMPALAMLDAAWLFACATLAAGRYGCTHAGCCHGVRASVGVRYPPSTEAPGGVVRAPVQLVEAGAWALLGVGSFAALGAADAGLVTAGGVAAYAILRTALEGWRADARGHLLGVPAGRWSSGIALVVAGGVATAAGQPPGPLVIAGALAAAALAWTLPRWLAETRPVEPAEDMAGFAAELAAARPAAPVVHLVGGRAFAGMWSVETGSWTFSTVDPGLDAEDASLLLGDLAARVTGEPCSAPAKASPHGLWLLTVSSRTQACSASVPEVTPDYFTRSRDTT